MAQEIKVDFWKHDTTNLIIATSEDMRGLFVAGHTLEEVEGRVPEAIRSIEVAKKEIADVRREVVSAAKPRGFRPLSHHRQFEVEAA